MKKSDLAEKLPKIQKAGLVESQYEDIKKL